MKSGPSPSGLLALWLAIAPAIATAATPVFMLDTDEETYTAVFRVDPADGQLALLGSLPIGLGHLVALAAASAERLYAVAQNGEVLEIALEPFAFASLGNVGPNGIVGLAFSDGQLYAEEEVTNALYRISLPALEVTRIGEFHLADGSPLSILGGDLAVSGSGEWYLWTNSREALYRFDARDATAMPVDPSELERGFHSGLAFDYQGTRGLLALARDHDALEALDLASGASAASVGLCLDCPTPYPASSGDLASPRCTDRDRDGFAPEPDGCGPIDCDDGDARIHPGAREICNAADDDCDGVADGDSVCLACPRGKGFWKRHPGAWPVVSLDLGARTYRRPALLALLRAPVHGDASLRLGAQLASAKLNLAFGADAAPVSASIAAADALLAGFAGDLPYHVRPASRTGRAMLAQATRLEAYNEAALAPACVPAPRQRGADEPACASAGGSSSAP